MSLSAKELMHSFHMPNHLESHAGDNKVRKHVMSIMQGDERQLCSVQ